MHNSLIPHADLEEVFPGIGLVLIKTIGKFDSFRAGTFSREMGYLVSPRELQSLCALAKKISPQKIVEIGTHQGWTTANLALNAPPTCQIITLDIFPVIPGNSEIQEILQSPAITLITADSTQYDFSAFHGAVDFIFIDGSHLEDDIEKDSQTALKMLSPKGIIVWHDYNLKFPSVVNCLHRLSSQIKIRHIPGTALAFHYRG